jgi:sugar lactone lactonase YvrE
MFKNAINSNVIRLSQCGASVASPSRNLFVRPILAVLMVAMISAAGFVRPRIGIAFQGAGEATIRTFTFPIANTGPAGLIQGPDDNLWICLIVANKIARMTSDGKFTMFDVPTPNSVPFLITEGPDGALWFTEQAGNKIGRITTSGAITEFNVPTPGSQPTDITKGPDGNLWFTEISGNKIGRITPSGVITEFPLPTPARNPGGIVAGPDDALYFTEVNGNRIGRITTSGQITEFGIPTPNSFPTQIIQGPDGHLWFTETGANKLGRFSPFVDDTSTAVAPASSPELRFQQFTNPDPSTGQSLVYYKDRFFFLPGPIGSKMGALAVPNLNHGGTISLPSGSRPAFVTRFFNELAVSYDGANAIALVTPTGDFDYCIKDDNTGAVVKFNSGTGEYMAQLHGTNFGGTGQVTQNGGDLILTASGMVQSVRARVRLTQRIGTASFSALSPSITHFKIVDKNIDDNLCAPDKFETVTAVMNPANIVPPLPSNNPEGNASGVVIATFSFTPGLNGPLAGRSFVTVNPEGFPNTSRFTGAHIHEGPAGQNGIRRFSQSFALPGPGSLAKFESPFNVSEFLNGLVPSQAASNFYFDLHTEHFPTGAIRGQLMVGPKLFGAEIQKKKLIIYGEGFEPGAKILLNGEQQKTANDEQSTNQILIAPKSGKRIAPGEEVTLQVRQPNGAFSNQKIFIREE